MVYVFLAEGFEEIEALTQVDLLRRAGIEVKTVSVTSEKEVCGSHGIKTVADCLISETDCCDANMIILPGGMPGVTNLYGCEKLLGILKSHFNVGGKISAICAAPLILGRLGILDGKMATCYPGFENELSGANYFDCPVVVDGNIITAKSAGAAIDFAAEIISSLLTDEAADKVLSDIYYE